MAEAMGTHMFIPETGREYSIVRIDYFLQMKSPYSLGSDSTPFFIRA